MGVAQSFIGETRLTSRVINFVELERRCQLPICFGDVFEDVFDGGDAVTAV